MQTADPFEALNTLPAAQVVELAASTPAHVTAAFGPHKRLFPDPSLDTAQLLAPGFFASLPDRMDGGIDDQWGSQRHRVAVRIRRCATSLRERRAHKPQPVYLRGTVNGAVKGIIVGLLFEGLLVGAIVAFVIARKLY